MEKYDVIVFGAGAAGICAAIQAARAGMRTLLAEKNGVCGGTMTSCGISWSGLFDAWGKQVIAGIGWDILMKTLKETDMSLPEQFLDPESNREHWLHQIRFDPLIFAALADQELVESGVEVKYHTMCAALERMDREWKAVLCGKDGLYPVSAKVIIDCTGDANAVKIAGYGVREIPEPQPGTLSVFWQGGNPEAADMEEIRKNYEAAVQNGELRPTDIGWGQQFNSGFLFSGGNNLNHISGMNAGSSEGKTKMEMEGRKAVLRLYRFMKKQKGLEKIRFHMTSSECGVRESRTVIGKNTVTAEDYLAGKRYPDSICYAFYQIDCHNVKEGLTVFQLEKNVVPCVPLSALIPADSHGFLAAGRILSSDRLANSALRVQAVCMATGQAAGGAAALAVKYGKEPDEVPFAELCQLLRENGAVVPQ